MKKHFWERFNSHDEVTHWLDENQYAKVVSLTEDEQGNITLYYYENDGILPLDKNFNVRLKAAIEREFSRKGIDVTPKMISAIDRIKLEQIYKPDGQPERWTRGDLFDLKEYDGTVEEFIKERSNEAI